MRRYDPTDEQCSVLAPMLQLQHGNGRQYRDHRTIISMVLDSQYRVALVRVARTLRAIEDSVPSFQSRARRGIIDRILEALCIRLKADRLIEWLKRARHITARHETTPVNFLAMLKITMIQHYFKTALRDACAS